MRIPLSNFIQIKTSLTIFRAPLQRQKRNSVRKLKYLRKPITERHVRSLVISEMETNKKEMENKIADGIENFSTSILAFIEVRLKRFGRTSSCHNESFVIEHATRLFVRSVNLTVVQIPNLWPPLHRILPVSFCEMKVGCFRHKKC
ncbi:hypothetical protein BWQ96_10375 [Gracilariopsis chorda]|uniref:Uncharacterized protein n=1 Tax=Gracilariopsis chorda TaxID=448386 RepID=A0A2V3ICT7_9FLOR|nr:hypothetical protein BWQ96_10375 [Gracilariopsis chorda]|eukprot:PXF39902.1 hypothetical protein BWQ96_10375 [Gracilariopsis chorda]